MIKISTPIIQYRTNLNFFSSCFLNLTRKYANKLDIIPINAVLFKAIKTAVIHNIKKTFLNFPLQHNTKGINVKIKYIDASPLAVNVVCKLFLY